MKVFISWSGPKSQQVAQALEDWMPDVIQDVECALSRPAPSGAQAWREFTTGLAATGFGILCLTAENQESPAFNFEAGALATTIGDQARVVPITFDFPVGSLGNPLRQFGGVDAGRQGMLDLMKSVNAAGPMPRSTEALDRAFETWWPQLEARFSEIVADSGEAAGTEPPKAGDDLVQEVLDVVRAIANVQVSRPPS